MRSSRETRSHVQGERRQRKPNRKLTKQARRTLAVLLRDARRMRNRYGVRAMRSARPCSEAAVAREHAQHVRSIQNTASRAPEKASKFGRARTTLRLEREAQQYACERADLQQARKSGDAQRRVCRGITADIAALRQ